MMIAQIVGLEPGEFIHTLGDAHIYTNHINQVKEQLSRTPMKLPKLRLNKKINSLFDFKFEDIELIDYKAHPHIKADVAI